MKHLPPVPTAVATALLALALTGCSWGGDKVDKKLLDQLTKAERAPIDDAAARLKAMEAVRDERKKEKERVASELDVTQKMRAAAEAWREAEAAAKVHASTHVSEVDGKRAAAKHDRVKAVHDALTAAEDHADLRLRYANALVDAAERAVALGQAELEKAQVMALVKANKVDRGKIKNSEFAVSVTEAQVAFAEAVEAAAKARVALVKAKGIHESRRQDACRHTPGGTAIGFCGDTLGLPHAEPLPEAEFLELKRAELLRGDPPAPAAKKTPPPAPPPEEPRPEAKPPVDDTAPTAP